MKIRMALPSKSFVADINEDLAKQLFSDFVFEIFNREGNSEPTLASSAEAVEELKPQLNQHSGALCLQCEECNDITCFFTKSPISHFYHRQCGNNTPLAEHLGRVYARCKCGFSMIHRTNIVGQRFDISCRDCQAPIDLEWDERREQYVSMGGLS